MTERDLLLSAVCASPGDAPRLVFADWLQENGEPERAEFIRLKVEDHLLIEPGQDERYDVILERAGELQRPNWRLWLREVAGREQDDWTNPGYEYDHQFVRGFPFQVWVLAPEPFLSDWPLILRRVPVEHLGINCRLDLAAVLGALGSGRLRELEFGTGASIDDGAADAVAEFAAANPMTLVKLSCRVAAKHRKRLEAALGERVVFLS
jgi:uncharacterized protein (TIGR02996 family)